MAPTGGQRSSTGLNANADVSDVQVAASNSTLNTWVGRRQPSWLANAKPVKPTPRPPPQPPKPPVITETTSPIVAAPQPASVPVSAPVTTPAPPQRSDPSSSRPSRPSHPPSRPLIQTQTSTSAAHTILPSPAPSDEPSPDVAETQKALPTTDARFVLDTSPHDHHEEQAQIRVSTVHPRTSSRQSKGVSDSPRTSTPTNMALNTPPTPTLPSMNTNVLPNVPPREVPDPPPAKRLCVKSASRRFLESCNASLVLQTYLQNVGGEQGLDMLVERPRYQLLADACNEGDLFFIALHQLFCTWALCQANVHALCDENIHNPSLVDNAMGTMGTILKSNSKIRRDRLEWFASFPVPLHSMRNAPFYQNTLKKVLDFLVCVAHTWMAIHHDHQMNGYPLLVSELLDGFLLFSPILQAIMFRASRRSLGIAEGPLAMRMESWFKSDQTKHRSADGTLVRFPQSPEYQQYNLNLIRGYKIMIAQGQQSQANLQGIQQFSPSGSPSIQTVLQPPRVGTPRMHPQMQRNPDQVSGFRSVLTQWPDTSTSEATFGNQSLYPRSPVNTPSNVPSPVQTAGGAFYQAPPAQFVIPSNHSMPNSPATMMSLPSTLPSHPVAPNLQMQFNQRNPQIDAPSTQLYQQQVQTRLAQQSPHLPTTSPHPIPNTMRRHNQVHSMQSTGQRPQGSQNFGGQPTVHPRHASDPRIQIPNAGGFAPDMQQTPHPLYSMNQFQSPGIHPQSPLNPQFRYKAPSESDRDRFVPSPGMRIPMPDYPHNPYDRRSIEVSLHQAHLRSPRRMPRELGPAKAERYYQALKCFALPPVPVLPHPYLYQFKFTISELDHAKLTRDEIRPGEAFPVNLFSNESLRVRVRCCYRKKSSAPFPENTWSTTDTKWPEHISMELNCHTLSVMRKAHHSKDLPVEASSFIVPGENSLDIHIPERCFEPPGQEPYIAVELVETLSHSAVLRMVEAYENVPASTTREIIKTRLRGSSSKAADDELAIVDYLSIDLADPFSRTMFKIPVRGMACTHLECFDLETWLNTRLGKKSCYCNNASGCGKCPNEPSFVDKWKCPLCNGDARPYSLRIDGFLVEVRSQLEMENKLGTKSILVSPDGTWTPKEEPGNDDSDIDSDEDDASLPSKKPPASSIAPFQHEKPPVEIIELDD